MASTSSGAASGATSASSAATSVSGDGVWAHPEGKNSFVWDYFEENKAKGLIRCTMPGCSKKYKHTDGTSTTNYRRHLKNTHFIVSKKKDGIQPKIDEKYDREPK